MPRGGVSLYKTNRRFKLNIDNLTYGELKEIAGMFRNESEPKKGLFGKLKQIFKMNTDNLKYGGLKEIAGMFQGVDVSKQTPFIIGKSYFVRTVTMATVGKLKAVYDEMLVFESASWIADTGRFNDALKKGFHALESAEIELFINDVFVSRSAIVDATEYTVQLPTSSK